MDILLAIVAVKRDYGNHPCGTRFCRCGWIFYPPTYPGDYWDCSNPDCGKSVAPTAAQIKRMRHPRLVALISAK